MITAPYNFVPLNKEVFYPSWRNQVSHDIPFEDGESGEIDITITAKSPIFIRDHENKEQFCQHNGEYYIPSSSVKGMVRNVLEIMSFSKMNPNFVDDKTYAVRDLRNQNLYMNHMKPQKIFCGWLIKEGNNYKIEDCGIPGRISQDKINKNFAKKFKHKSNNGEFNPNKADTKTAKYKYELLTQNKIELIQNFQHIKNDKGRDVYEFGGTKQGTLVVTGQASGRKDQGKFDAKIYEFVFFDRKNTLDVSKEVMENFKFAYFDDRKTEPKESPDWKYWKEKLKNGKKVPVFFQKENNQIKHFGLSYLYKLPYSGSVHDGIYDTHFSNELDLSETIFGLANKDNALKGRVQFSHFKVAKNSKATQMAPRTENLGTPRASFFPFYVMQEDGKLYSTFMDDEFVLAGRKRYPIHKNKPDETKIKYEPNSSIGTSFRPLKEGVIFEGKLRYHNLKKAELGAILSALTFHNTQGTFHNIGLAKALGYGKIEITFDEQFQTISYLQEFETQMIQNIPNWLISNQLKELLTMATPQENSGNSQLSYMELPSFADVKRDKLYLKNYSKLNNIKLTKLLSLMQNSQIQHQPQQKQNIEHKIVKENKEHISKEYSICDIAQKVNKSTSEVLDFIQKSTLPISKKLNKTSILKEAQAIGLINQMNKQK